MNRIHQAILELRDDEGWTFREIGAEFELSRQRVHKIYWTEKKRIKIEHKLKRRNNEKRM